MQTQGYERINILLPKQTARQLRRAVPRGKRSHFVKEAIEKQLAQKGQDIYQQLLKIRQKGPKVGMEEVVQWIREDRQSH